MGIKQSDIVIIGAGAAGLALAALLGQAGLRVVIVDPHPPARLKKTSPSGRTVALMQSSLNIVKACGVWAVLEPYANPMEMMKIIDDSRPDKEPIEIEFPASDIGLEAFGYNIPNAILRAALFEHVKSLKTVEFIESRFHSYSIEKIDTKITLENKKSIQAPLLVAADGRNSAVREFAGITAKTKKYDQSAMTFIINHSRPHQNISTEFHRPNGPMALVPLPGGHQSSVVWVERTDKAEALIRLKKGEFEHAFQEKTLHILGGITLETGPECWPLCTMKAAEIAAPRLAFMAEAAHVMSPITAQGLNLSLRDVAALAESIIDAARLGLDIGSQTVLGQYQKRRRADIETRVFGVDTLNKVVSTHAPALKRLRRAGLKSLDTLSPLKALAMHVGLAPQMDQGRLAKGEAL